MGETLISFYKNNLKQRWKIAFFTAFLTCFLVHIYKLTNTLPNHDSLFNVYTNQDVTASGRWFLQYACCISSYFDLPWVNGLLCAVYLGITSAAVAELFEMDDPVLIGLSSIILVTCPSTTETMFFGYTADGYLLGLSLAAISACLSVKETRNSLEQILCIVLLCITTAIYQAYISFAAVLCAGWLIHKMVCSEIDFPHAFRWIIRHIILYCCALAAYYLIWKGILVFTGQSATSYQGISEVGTEISLSTLMSGAVKSIQNLLFLFLEWNILEHPVTFYGVMNIVFFLCFGLILIVAVRKCHAAKGALSFTVLIAALCIPVMSIWCFVSNGVAYRPMMLHSAVVLYIVALVFADRWLIPRYSTLFAGLAMIMVFNFAVMANIGYFYLDKCYERSYYIGSQLMEDITEQTKSNSNIQRIAFVGDRAEDVAVTPDFPGIRIHILSSHLEEDLLYDHIHSYLFLQETFGLELDRVSEAEAKDLANLPDVKNLEQWPKENSDIVIDDLLIIKISE